MLGKAPRSIELQNSLIPFDVVTGKAKPRENIGERHVTLATSYGGRNELAQDSFAQSRSTAMATASPPPMHSDAFLRPGADRLPDRLLFVGENHGTIASGGVLKLR